MHTSIRHHNRVEQIRITLKKIKKSKETYGWHWVCSVFDDELKVGFVCLAWLSVLNRDVVHVQSGELAVGCTVVEEMGVLQLLIFFCAVVEQCTEH
jgi:hypothetical protein